MAIDSKDFKFQPDSDTPEEISFKMIPSNYRDTIKSLEVVDTNKILGFNTFNNLLMETKSRDNEDRESDFYNVTVNLVVRRMSQFKADQKQMLRSAQKDQRLALFQQQSQEAEEKEAPNQILTQLVNTMEEQGSVIIKDSNEEQPEEEEDMQQDQESVVQ